MHAYVLYFLHTQTIYILAPPLVLACCSHAFWNNLVLSCSLSLMFIFVDTMQTFMSQIPQSIIKNDKEYWYEECDLRHEIHNKYKTTDVCSYDSKIYCHVAQPCFKMLLLPRLISQGFRSQLRGLDFQASTTGHLTSVLLIFNTLNVFCYCDRSRRST